MYLFHELDEARKAVAGNNSEVHTSLAAWFAIVSKIPAQRIASKIIKIYSTFRQGYATLLYHVDGVAQHNRDMIGNQSLTLKDRAYA